jgi:Flp pilus assembly protein TadG
MASLRPFRHHAGSERGAELIEFALVLPLLLLVVLGIVDFGFLFQRLEVVTNAAREGARIAILPGYLTADVNARVNNYMSTGGLAVTPGTNPTINVANVPLTTSPGAPPLNTKRVTVTYTNSYLFLGGIASWFGGSFSSVPLTGVATMRVEGAGS